MITRRSLEGALKCALRDFRREEATSGIIVSQHSISLDNFKIVLLQLLSRGQRDRNSRERRTGVEFNHLDRSEDVKIWAAGESCVLVVVVVVVAGNFEMERK